MPTFNQLKDKSGYYIRAWTPDTGNITYKLKSEADPIIKGYGLRHEDEISWDVIKSLKLLRLIYTDGSGIIEVGDFEPDPDQLEETSLSKQQAKSLLSTIQQHHDLTQDQLETICSILGINVPGLETDRLENTIGNRVESLLSQNSLPTAYTLNGRDTDNLSHYLVVKNMTEEDSGQIGLRIQLFTDDSKSSDPLKGAIFLSDETVVTHDVFISLDQGITKWLTSFDNERSWEAKSEALCQVGQLMTIIIEQLKSAGINLGHPDEFSGPVLRDFDDMPF